MDFTERVNREKESYDHGDVLDESRKLQAKFHHVFSSPNAQRIEQYLNANLEKSPMKYWMRQVVLVWQKVS